MPVIEFEYSQEGTPGGQTHGLKHEVAIANDAVTYETLREAEGSFLRWFQANHPNHSLIMWKAKTPKIGVLSEYRALLPYGTPKSNPI